MPGRSIAAARGIVDGGCQGAPRPLPQRVPALPDVPTIAEAGIKGFDASSWGGIVAPAGTPAPVVQLLHKQVVDALQLPDVKSRLADLGAVVVASTPEEFQKYIGRETEKWGQVAKANNIRLDCSEKC